MTLARVAGLTAIVAVATPGLLFGQSPSLATVMEPVGGYVTTFQHQLSNIVTEERYVQNMTRANVVPGRFASDSHRERSDVLLVQPRGTDRYVAFRDVFEVDGRLVRDRQDRLTALFLDPTSSAEAQIERINQESARYNIGNIERTINTPTLPLLFLLRQNQPRFRFTRDVAHAARVRREAMYDVASRCLDWLAVRPGRHSLIVVSGGFAHDPDGARYYEVVTRSLRANAPVHFLDARGLQGMGRYQGAENSTGLSRRVDEGPFGWSEAAQGSTDLADDTGGISVTNSNDIDKGLDRLLDTMTTYYLIAYEPTARDKPGYRKIKVEARARGLRVRARSGYFSGPPAPR